MSRKRIRRIIISVSVFYVLVAVMAFLMLKDTDSVLAKQTMAEILFEKEPVTEQSSTQDSPEDILERWTKVQDAPPEPVIPELLTEDPTEVMTELPVTTELAPVTERVTEQITERDTETVRATENGPEQGTEEDKLRIEVKPQADGKYYLFEYENTKQRLLMRESGNKTARVVGDMKAHTKGAVLELADGWSKVYAGRRIGYCYTEYIQIREVTEDAYRTFLKENGVLQ